MKTTNMNGIEFEVKLFDTTALAADGSNIPRRSCEEYLQSSDYQTIVRDKVAIGGLSHKDRRLKPELKGLIGMDDQVLIHDNALFYITKLYFKDGDNFLYARAKTFDPDLFSGQRADNIRNLIGMFESGVRMPVSVVIQALWSKRGTAEKIIRIKGFDFTQNPSFKGAGDIKIFSELITDTEVPSDDQLNEYIANFSVTDDITLGTKVFSMDSVVTLVNDTISCNMFSEILSKYPSNQSFSYVDIVGFYGQGSIQERSVRDIQSSYILRSELFSEGSDPNVPEDQRELIGEISKYICEDNSKNLQLLIRKPGINNSLSTILKSVPETDPNRSEILSYRLNQFFDNLENKEFSTDINTVSDRIRTANQPRYTKLQRILKSYKTYWNTNKLSEQQKYKCKILLLQDLNILIKDVLDKIYKGESLNGLYGLSQYGKDIKDKGISLSNIYRKVLISEKLLKFIPKGLYAEWSLEMREFYQSILIYTFGEGLPQVELGLLDIK